MLAVVVAACVAAEIPAAPAVVEFYAPWCPVCQRFAPHWAAVSSLVQPPVAAASVNCDETDCQAWGVRAYPTVAFFAADSTVDVYTGTFTADAVAAWLAGSHGVTFAASGTTVETTAASPAAPVAAPVADASDAFSGFDQLSPTIVSASDYIAATTIAGALAELPGGGLRYDCVRLSIAAGRAFAGCPRAPAPAGLCRGRFPCVVWALLHTLVATAPTDASAVERLSVGAVAVIRWFPCAECVTHFRTMVAGSGESFPLASVKSRRGAVLWLWSAHNAVNARRGVGLFPLPGMCSDCTSEEAVVALLDRVYAPPPPPKTYRRSGTVAATVAVLGIAAITLGFAVRACYTPVATPRTASLLETEPDEAPPAISVPDLDDAQTCSRL